MPQLFEQVKSLDQIELVYKLGEASAEADPILFSAFDSNGETNLSDHSVHWVQKILEARKAQDHNFRGAKIPVPTHWNLELLDNLLVDYEDREIVDFLRYGWPMSRDTFPLTLPEAKINHKGAYTCHEEVTRYIQKENSHNTLIGPFKNNPFGPLSASSPLAAIPKKDSEEKRIILDMSYPDAFSVNDGIDKTKYLGAPIKLAFPTIDAFAAMVRFIGPGALMYKRDLRRAYRQIWTCLCDVPYQGFYWNKGFYFDLVLVMGCTSSAYICQRVTSAIAYIHQKQGALSTNYLDDFLGVDSANKAQIHFTGLGLLLQELGVWESEQKACPPSTQMLVLGVLFNTADMTMSLSQDKIDDIQAELKEWLSRATHSRKQLEKLIGKLQFAAQVVRAGRVFIARLLDELRGAPHIGNIPTSTDIQADVNWWLKVMPFVNGTKSLYTTFLFKPGALIDTDATLVAAGGVCGKFFFRARFPAFIRQQTSHISQLELLALVVAIKLWGHKHTNTKFWVRLDNEASVYAINSGRTSDKFMNSCLRELAFQSAKFNIEVKARHIVSAANTLPDLLSRWYRSRSAQQKFCQLTRGKGMRHSYVHNKMFLFDNNW